MENWIYPKKLKPGMTIAFLAPATGTEEDLSVLESICQERGYQAIFAPSCYRRGLYGGTEEELIQELNQYLTDDSCQAVVCLRGGYGTMRYLDKLDYKAIAQARKAFVGYSDVTALHLAIQKECHMISYHGPMGVDWIKSQDQAKAGSPEAQASYQKDLDALFDLLEGKIRVIEPLPEPPRGNIGTQLGEGTLIGGNMTLLAMMAGTPWGLDSYSEAELADTILFLEDVGEAPYKLDRMLQQLRLQGILSKIKGIAFGSFLACEGDEDEADYDIGYAALRYMEEGRSEDYDEPFVCYLPTGHGTPHQAIPLGDRVSFRYISNTLILMPYCKDE